MRTWRWKIFHNEVRISYQNQDWLSEYWLRFGTKQETLRLLQGFDDSCGWNFRRRFRMWEKINGKCCFRSKEKVLEGSNGLTWGSIQTAVWHGVRLCQGPFIRYLWYWVTGGQDDSSEQWSPSLQLCSDMWCLLVEILRSWESRDCSRPWLFLDVGL